MSRRGYAAVILVSGSLLLYLCYSGTNSSVWLRASSPQPEPLEIVTHGSHKVQAPAASLTPSSDLPRNALRDSVSRAPSSDLPRNALRDSVSRAPSAGFPRVALRDSVSRAHSSDLPRDALRDSVSRAPSAGFPRVALRDSVSRAGHQTETRQVVFAKVHKAASSTVQNILLRFAMARNLSVLLPTGGPVISQTTSKIKREKVIPSIEGKELYDILCSHVLYEEEEINKYFPKSAFRVAIIREPMKQALSALTYYTVTWAVKELKGGYDKHKTDPITGFLKHPEDFSGGKKCPSPLSFVSNRMSYDLGLEVSNAEEMEENGTKIQTFLKKLETEFNLVLISDYFESSMILLKRSLNWSMKDIIYIKVNEMLLDKDSVWRKKPKLTPAQLLAFRRCNKLDYVLYEHFLPIFHDKVEREPLFEEEVAAYKRVLKSVSDFCHNAASGEKLLVQRSRWTEEFDVSRHDCALMMETETAMVKMVRKRQLQLRKEYILSHRPVSLPKQHLKERKT
ncbi:hypothetical protein RRG08_006209 [Elysia crispata]|uniref:Galactosylceramide sulfotransferase-like n=1 Tax=Elysia crispata TaxID=231223 RepID=A0AAE0Y8A5_9GAST|nr:hypothetical protein RRG08_006209 [Elysia crispata]